MPKYYSITGKPWQFAGVSNVEDCKTSEEVMNKAGLNFIVDKCELYAKMPVVRHGTDAELDWANQTMKDYGDEGHMHKGNLYANIQDAYATYRTDHNIPLGLVKSKYTVVQNSIAFQFFDDAIEKGKVRWQTAGAFGKGETIFVSAKLPKDYLVNGKDPVENYLVFTNSHDGTSGVRILFTPIRIICQNCIAGAIKAASAFISFRHTASIHSNIQLAHQVIAVTKRKSEELGQYYDALSKIQVKDEDVMQYITENVLSEDEFIRMKETGHTPKELCYRDNMAFEDSKISMKKLNVISDIWQYYNYGIGQREIIGTAWGAYNAVTGYYSNVDTYNTGAKRMQSLLYGDRAKKLQTAAALAETF